MSHAMTEPTQSGLRVSDFDFHLPEELIAQQPPAQRGASRMLILNRTTGAVEDSTFANLPSLLNPGDLLVLNDSRVIPARLYARRVNRRGKQEATGQIEVLLTHPDAAGNWNALVKPGRKVRPGDRLEFPDASGEVLLEAEVISSGEFGERTIRFAPAEDFYGILDQIGHMPLPPYIKRDDATTDRDRYQTVFAAQRGSVAAPTAGLHFTPEILNVIAERGVEIAKVTLHVGLGTFAPLRVENVADIQLHTEHYTLPTATAEALNRARSEGRRIVAVGTTTVRTLEHCAQTQSSHRLEPHTGQTNIFISPGHKFSLVDAMLTNFHLPQSSLLMLVSAFAGREQVLTAYNHAVQQQYRFFSYGDCMFLA
jgi:S-adenosylmethionine:tRNA ribosyltransferase-isomerase